MKEEKFTESEVAARNESLREASRVIFGGSAELRIVNPATLVLLKQNARYFKKEQFKQLVSNIKEDQRLSSTPFCCPCDDGRLEVLSGNHRVKASIEAGLPWILVIVALIDLKSDDRLKIQLSHNALVGEDDEQILAELWSKIDDIKAKCYAGLSSEKIEGLQKIKMVTLTTPQIRTRQVSFAFVEVEVEALDQIMSELARIPADKIYLVPMQQFQDFFEIIQQVKKRDNVKNGSLAMLGLIDIASRELGIDKEARA